MIETTEEVDIDVSIQKLGGYFLFDDINTQSSKDLCEFILKCNLLNVISPTTIFINSPGGSVYDGFAITDLMQCSKTPIHTTAIGSIASMAVLITMAGVKGERRITKNTDVMVHQFSAFAYGKQHELMAQQNSFKLVEERMMRHFLKHTNMKEKEIRDIAMGPTDRWLTAKECKKFGICDHIIDTI